LCHFREGCDNSGGFTLWGSASDNITSTTNKYSQPSKYLYIAKMAGDVPPIAAVFKVVFDQKVG